MDWSRKWLFDFNTGKAQLISFDQSNKTGATDVKIHRSVLEENSSLKSMGLNFSLNWIGALTLSLFLKLPSTELEPCFVL